MTFNLKRIYSYLFYTAAGLFNLIFMFMNYAVLFISANGESESKAFSAYGCIKFGEESLGTMLTEFIEGMGKEPKLTFLTVLVSVIMILVIIASIVLLLAGAAGLVKEFAKVNILGPLDGAVASRVSGIVFTVNFGMHIASAVFIILASLCNLYSGEIFGTEFKMGMRPGLGMYFLLVLAVGLWVAFTVLKKKFSKPSAPVEKTIYKCLSCEAVFENEAKFCSVCGAAVVPETVTVSEDSAEEPAAANIDFAKIVAFFKNVWTNIPGFLEKNKISKKMLCTVGAAIGALVLALIILAIVPRPQIAAYVESEADIMHVYDAENEKTLFVVDGKLSKHTLDGRVAYEESSVDGKTLALTDGESTLYVFTKKGVVKVDEKVSSYRISADGNGLAYVNEDGELMLYNVGKKKAEKISDELLAVTKDAYVISPDGKTVAFLELSDEEYSMYISVNGKEEKVGNNLIPLGVSDKAKFIYYYDSENQSFYVQKKGKEEVKLVNGVSVMSNVSMIFNADHTQVLFSSDNGWYISDSGKEKVKISSKGITAFGNYEGFEFTFGTSSCMTSPVKTFVKQYFLRSDGDLCYINKKFEAVTVAEDVDRYLATPSYDVIYYVDGGTVYRGEGYKDKFKKVADDANDLVITRDGKACYYINDDDELMYVKKTGKAKKIADDASELAMTHDGYALFMTDYSYMSGGTLCSSKNGSKKKKVADDVLSASVEPSSTYYYVRNEDDSSIYDLYGTKSKAKFKLIVKEVTM